MAVAVTALQVRVDDQRKLPILKWTHPTLSRHHQTTTGTRTKVNGTVGRPIVSITKLIGTSKVTRRSKRKKFAKVVKLEVNLERFKLRFVISRQIPPILVTTFRIQKLDRKS